MNQTTSKALTKEFAATLIRAGEYFQILARRNELPLSPAEFEERVAKFFETLEGKYETANALVYAALENQPVPVSFFSAWASPPTIRKWRMAKENPLPVLQLNGKNCVRPSDFFAALRRHGQ